MSNEKEKKGRKGSNDAPLVIGIGASAGGLEALQQFFDCMPSHNGLSFVIIQHLSPDYKSLMADILCSYRIRSCIFCLYRLPVGRCGK